MGKDAEPRQGDRKRALVGIQMGGNLRQGLAYGNHHRVRKNEGGVLRIAVSDMAVGRAMGFMVENKERIHL